MKSSKVDGKIREFDRLFRKINEVGGMEELVKFIREYKNSGG